MDKKDPIRNKLVFGLILLLVIIFVLSIQNGSSSRVPIYTNNNERSDYINIKESVLFNSYKIKELINIKEQFRRDIIGNFNKELGKKYFEKFLPLLDYESKNDFLSLNSLLDNKKLPLLFQPSILSHNELDFNIRGKVEQSLDDCGCGKPRAEEISTKETVSIGLSGSDILQLQKQGELNGWTFTVGENSVTNRSINDLCGFKQPNDWEFNAEFNPCKPLGDLPESFDWRDINGTDLTTPVKDQGSCGSCWAFATIGPLECNIKIEHNITVNLSEQWLVSCNRDGWSCNGGWNAHDYLQWKTDSFGGTGAVLEQYFPYEADDVPCDGPYIHSYEIGSWAYIDDSYGIPSVNAIKKAIMDYGPVSVGVATSNAFYAYNGGIFNANSSSSVSHAVNLVGWDDSQGTNGVWFLRNSWGSDWGENGYMRIEYYCNSVGYAACYIDYPGTIPDMNSTICGYINDLNTGSPIQDVIIDTYWYDPEDHKYGNSTNSDVSGFYTLNASAGEINFEIDNIQGYYSYYPQTLSIGEDEILWMNISLTPIPPENSIVFGFVTDKDDGNPVEDAYVGLWWEDDQGHWNWNYTYTDSSGFYSINTAAGDIQLYVSANGYFSNWTDWYTIGEDDFLWIDISLVPKPPENSFVFGYITNSSDGSPIENAEIVLTWQDDQGHWDWNYTYSDSSGFYFMNVAAGELTLYVSADGYFSNWTDWYTIEDNGFLWLDISLDPRPPENSIVFGFITNETDGSPIEDALVDLYWEDGQGHSDWNYTYTDSSGLYIMDVAAGDIMLSVDAYGYFYNQTDWYTIGEDDFLWLDITLYPYPPENSMICGFVTNKSNGDYIEDAFMDLWWEDDQGHWNWNYTYTNSSGFYNISVAAGEIDLWVYADGYFSNWTGFYTIGENEILWINISLEPIPPPPEPHTVYGYLYIDNETAPSDIEVMINFSKNPEQISDTTDSNGYYQIDFMGHEWDEGFFYVYYQYDWYIPEDNQSVKILQNVTGYEIDLHINTSIPLIPPIANANGPYNGFVNIPITFNSSGSYAPDGIIVSYLWNLGDGNTSSDPNPTHTYNIDGNFTLSLTVTDDNGSIDTDVSYVLIEEDIDPPSNVTGLKVVDAKDGKLDLLWDAATDNAGVDHYKVYRDNLFISNVSGISYRDKGLTNGQLYVYNVSAVDASGNEGNRSVSASGKPKASSSGGGGDVGGFPFVPPPPQNIVPIADAGGPYYGFIVEEIEFDGSKSSDDDGTITNYTWDFGDKTSGYGVKPTHTYSNAGRYTVSLIVTDNLGSSNEDKTIVEIAVPNKVPSAPFVDGPIEGTQNIKYSFSAVSTDEDNDTIQYTFDWDDGTSDTTDFLPNGTPTMQTHIWKVAGKYTIDVQAYDNKTPSEIASYTILIDAFIVEDIGYFTDDDSDGTYDTFHGETMETDLGFEDGKYLIDTNGDGNWNYTYDTIEGLVIYKRESESEIPLTVIIGVIVAIMLVIMILYILREKY